MTRFGIALLGLLLWSASLSAQQAAVPSADMQQLQDELKQLTSSLQAMRSEVQACRDEIRNLRTELEAAKSEQPGGAADNGDAAHAVADLREDQSVTDSRLATLYQSKVESGSKYRVRLSGLVLFNTYMNRGTVNTTSVPNLALPTPEGQPGGSIGATFRQTFFTLQAFGPEIAGARTSAAVQFGFYGGFTRTLDGYVQGLASLRTADIAFDWNKWSLHFMQDKPFISPLWRRSARPSSPIRETFGPGRPRS
jgi:outer membrane murein-binding lipoprotein Lpp